MSFPSVNVTLPFGTKYSVCDRNCQFLVVSVVMFNPFYVGSDDEEEGFNNNEVDRRENNKSLNSLNNNDEEPDNVQTNEDKLKIINVAREVGNSKAARMFNENRSNIINWRKKEEKIRLAVGNNKGRKRSLGETTTKVQQPEMELLLEQWLKDQRHRGFRITGDKIATKAKQLVNDLMVTII